MPKRLDNFHTSGFDALESRPVGAVSLSAGAEHSNSVDSHFYVVADVESSVENVDKVPMDDDVTRKEFAVCPFSPQMHRRK